MRKGKPWEGAITSSRHTQGAYYTLVPKLIRDTTTDDLADNRVGTFRNYFRLSTTEFNYVLDKISPLIQKQNTEMRECINPEMRLMVTLRYLATGSSMTSLHYEWCVSVASLSSIIPETCAAIYDSLKHELLSTPTTVDEWLAISNTLEENWNFPNAIGWCTKVLNLDVTVR